MSLLPNYKARLERANRNNVPVQSATDSFKKTKIFTIFLIIIFPIYPSLAAIGTVSQGDRGEYDESSIITAFNEAGELDYVAENGIVVVDGKNTPKIKLPSEETDKVPAEPNLAPAPVPELNVKTYTVVEYDDIIKIAKKYDLDPEVILWSNNLSMNDTLKVGQVLRIPPVSGLIHTLQSGETVSDVASRYSVSVNDILTTNNISDARKIQKGTKLMIPGAKKPVVVTPPETKKVVEKPAETKKVETKKTTTPKVTAKPAETTQVETPKETASETSVEITDNAAEAQTASVNPSTGLKDRYLIKFTGNGRNFAGGNCTWYVARYKTVTWRGNANQWIKNARAQGIPTGKTPVIGAIVQFSGRGYNTYYGHVGIVTDIQGDNLIVSDMNYRGLYEVTIRKVPINHPAIDGYIYVD